MANKYTYEDFDVLTEIISSDISNQENFIITQAYYDSMLDVFHWVGIRLKIPLRTIKRNFKKYSNELYEIIYKTKFKDIPLYINSSTFFVKQIVAWRLKIGK